MISDGCDDSISGLLTAHHDLIRSVVAWPKWRFTEDVRQDVAQDIHHSLMKSLASATNADSIRAFVKRICINRCVDEVRRQVRSRGVFTAMPSYHSDDGAELEAPVSDPTMPDAVELITRNEQLTELRSKFGSLNDTCQTAIRQFYLDEMSYKEMAVANGITVNTVGSRLAKCLAKLRTMVFES